MRSIHPLKGLQAVQKRSPAVMTKTELPKSPRDLISAEELNSTKCKTRESLLRICKEIRKSSPEYSEKSPKFLRENLLEPPEPVKNEDRLAAKPITTLRSKHMRSKINTPLFVHPPLNKMEAYFSANITKCPYMTGNDS